jgi:dihydrofolate reductase
MKKVILYIAESLDGFVAKKDGSVAWLDEFNGVPGVDYGYGKFIKNIDTVVQGNTTYQQFKDNHAGKNHYVFTETPDKYSDDGATFVKGSPRDFIEKLDERKHHNIWLVGGPKLLSSFLNEGQVDELIIFVMPVLLNDGISLFSGLEKHVKISLIDTTDYPNGVVELKYKAQ